MSLDEYLDLCEEAALTPLIGVNYNCHGEYQGILIVYLSLIANN